MSTVSSTPETVEFSGVDGIALVADEWNRGSDVAADRPSILMLHGGGQNRFSWKNTGQILADEGFHVVAIDARGHGDSDRAPGADYAVETLATDVMHVLDRIGRRVIVIGASMGGLTGILVAHRAGPQRVTGLVLVDVVPRFEKNGSARIRDFMFSGLHGFTSLEEAADAVAAYLPHRTKPRSPEGLKKNLRLRDGRWYWHWDPAFMTKPGDDPELRTESFERAAMELTIPVLLIRESSPTWSAKKGCGTSWRRCPGPSWSNCPRPGTPRPGTTTTRSAMPWWRSSIETRPADWLAKP